MPLRTGNNPRTDAVILAAMSQVAIGYPSANTTIGINNPTAVYVQQEYTMLQTASYPALLLQVGAQTYRRYSQKSFAGVATFLIDYYNSWPQNSATYDTIRAAIAADLELIKSNIESNDSLTIGANALTVSLMHSTLSPYAGDIRDWNGVTLVYRRLSLDMNILDYDALS